MASSLRGADVLARALACAGVRQLFSLSGNQIMPVYDAALDAQLGIVHVRHEAAAVHMADAWGRLTGEPGVALLTGGPGHANGVGALYTALAAESPLLMLSGHAPLDELGMGAFQEMRQADMAAPAVKAAFTAQSASTLGEDVARAWRHAKFGRPGPVHLSLPVDVLEAKAENPVVPAAGAFAVRPIPLSETAAQVICAELAGARRPLILAGPALATDRGREACRRLEEASGVPVAALESPRGLNDPGLGAFARVLAQADLVVLLGKQLDFALRFGRAPALAEQCRFIVLDPDAEALRRAGYVLGEPARILLAAIADPFDAASKLSRAGHAARSAWADEVAAALAYRPAEWRSLESGRDGALHPAEVGHAVQALLDRVSDAVLVADGGEFCQWIQACVRAPTRLINGPAGSIGSALPFAIAAKLARPAATVVAMLGDGTFGFHMAEYDTAVRAQLPFVGVVGNDQCWNAEHQIQLRTYGAERAHSCELLPTRYDQVAAALGGHGEQVLRGTELRPALERAAAAARPACVNVMIERVPAPTVHA